ncbi:hypothetical protein O181_010983 [Austropuccinia psidii MF-1]|uniref:Uncharacterized protein n=1 Tax=Austropuccinia psidii MF-1 TaxID=1389203 RepID=A0A9Q3BUE5_9BASI|nr:hypothetical protein [Austropuccinia psidii MF-1]
MHSEVLITEKKWTPVSTQRNRKPQSSASIQGKKTLRTSTGKITIINPVLTFKGKLPTSADKKLLQGTVKARGQRRPGRGHIGGWKDTERNHTHFAIHLPIQRKPQTRRLDKYGSCSLAPPTPQIFISMENEQQEVQPGIPRGRTWSKFPEDMFQRPYGNNQRLESHKEIQTPGGEGKRDTGESSHYPSIRRTDDPDRAY